MNINPVCNDGNCTAAQSFKGYEPKIKVVGKVDDYVQSMLDTYNAQIENQANLYKKNINVAQKDKALFFNSGTITSKIDLKKLSNADDFYRGIVDNLKANSEAGTKGLKKAFSRIV